MEGINFDAYECKYLHRLLQKQIVAHNEEHNLAETWINETFNRSVRKMQKELRRHADEVYDIEIKENDNEVR